MDKELTKKMQIDEAPQGWQVRLARLQVGQEIIVINSDNTANNGRGAIKIFIKKHPEVKFATKTDRYKHTFHITRTE